MAPNFNIWLVDQYYCTDFQLMSQEVNYTYSTTQGTLPQKEEGKRRRRVKGGGDGVEEGRGGGGKEEGRREKEEGRRGWGGGREGEGRGRKGRRGGDFNSYKIFNVYCQWVCPWCFCGVF